MEWWKKLKLSFVRVGCRMLRFGCKAAVQFLASTRIVTDPTVRVSHMIRPKCLRRRLLRAPPPAACKQNPPTFSTTFRHQKEEDWSESSARLGITVLLHAVFCMLIENFSTVKEDYTPCKAIIFLQGLDGRRSSQELSGCRQRRLSP